MRLSIRSQLLLPLLTLMVGVAGMSVWTGLTVSERTRRQIETQMDNVAATVRKGTFARSQQILQLMKRLSGAEFILCDARRNPVLDENQRPIATLPAVPNQLPDPDAVGGHPLGRPIELADQTYFARTVPLGSGEDANWTLYILYPESLWRDALWQALWPSLFLGILGGSIAVVLAVAVTQRLTRRIQELERRTRLIASGDFSPMVLPRRNDELRDLGRSVNEMAETFAQYQEKASKSERLRLLGQVSGGLAHQLRNGVTGARLAVQLHVRECPDDDEETLSVALRQLSLVETHLKRFLDLGKAIPLCRQPCDLREMVREALSLLDAQCRHSGIILSHQVPENPLLTSGDAGQLGHLLVNVLTNAMEAAGTGGKVTIVLGTTTPTQAFVDIVDSGAGPSPEIAKRLFEPFITGKPEGVGLGLAVARQVAKAHGGTIQWYRTPVGTCFRIQLPLVSHVVPP